MNPSRWPIVALLLLYFLAAVWMAFRLPAHATPNELLNFEYIQVMRQIRGLPNRGLVDSEIRYTEWHQPPVYFVWAALVGLTIPVPLSAVNPPPPIEVEQNPHFLSTPRGNLNPVVHVTPRTVPLLYTSRIAAALLGMVGVAALYRAGRAVYGPPVGLLMASLLAFQPGYLHLSGSVNNDMPLTAMIAIVMAFAILLLHRQEKTRYEIRDASSEQSYLVSRISYFVLGLLTALAILTKANGVFALAFPAVVLLGHLLATRRPGQTALAAAAVALGLLPLWAGWLWLNTVRMADTLGLSGSLPVGRVLALSPLDFGHLVPFLPAVWRSYWLDWSAGDVGYGPDWLYLFWLAAVGIMLLGWLKRGTRDERRDTREERHSELASRISYLVTLLVLLGFLGISYLYFAVKALTVKEAGWMVPEGRWWLPGLPALAWLLAAGFARWWSPARRPVACLVAAAVPPLIAFGLLLFHLPALYPAATPVALPVDSPALLVANGLELIAAEAGEMSSGHPAEVTLTWRATVDINADYTISTQVLIPAAGGWRKVAEHNSFPGQGMNPTRGWRAGQAYRDRLTLIPDGALNGPTEAVIQVSAGRDGATAPGDAPIAGRTVVRPGEPLAIATPLAEPVTFGDAIRLAGAVVEPSADGPMLTLWWQAAGTPAADFTVFVHVLDAAGQLVAQADGPPNEGLSPTGLWRAGDVVRDARRLPPGARALIGLYDPVTGARLSATQAGATLPDGAFVIPLGD
jgi:4-amino-4-deoxy-L-arabinose transferase-like glycosyltransferase